MGVYALMKVKTTENVTEKQIKVWAYKLASTFDHERFWIRRPYNEKGYPACRCLEKRNTPEDDRTTIGVNIREHYYGPGYERGDALFIVGVAEWLEHHIPKAEIWYGSDRLTYDFVKFDSQTRNHLLKHFYEYGHEPYRVRYHFTPLGSDIPGKVAYLAIGEEDKKKVQQCDLCEKPMTACGQNKHGPEYRCYGCGANWDPGPLLPGFSESPDLDEVS